MVRYILVFVSGCVFTAFSAWVVVGGFALGAETPSPTGYTLNDIYEFIVSNGSTDPVEGGHSLKPTGIPADGAMHTLTEIMAELRKKLPVSTGGGTLPATGQTKCYNTEGNEIDCTSADWPGQDGVYQTGCPMENRFVDNGDGTVTDTCTGLMWQQAAPGGRRTWQEALKYCESLEFAGHDDWRLPNVRELQSIVDYGRYRPAIDPVFSAESSYYWSSSTRGSNTLLAWSVFFSYGSVRYSYKTNVRYVRAVRGRP